MNSGNNFNQACSAENLGKASERKQDFVYKLMCCLLVIEQLTTENGCYFLQYIKAIDDESMASGLE